MKTLFVPTLSKLQIEIFDDIYKNISNSYKSLHGSDDVYGCYGDILFFRRVCVELINNLIHYEDTNNLEFSSDIKYQILSDAKEYWNFASVDNKPTTSELYNLVQTKLISDKVQFLRMNLVYLVFGKYNELPITNDFCTACYDKYNYIQTVVSIVPKNDLLFDVCKFSQWGNIVKEFPLIQTDQLSFNEYLKERINVNSVMGLFIVLTTMTRYKHSNIQPIASTILNQMLKHFKKYLN